MFPRPPPSASALRSPEAPRANGRGRRSAALRRALARVRAGLLILCLPLGMALPAPATAQTEVSRFASLRAERVNVRSGPGTRYPISWVFVRRGIPVEITAEFEFWRKIRDHDGTEGWVHQSLISGRRTALVAGALRALRDDASASSSIVLYAEPGVQGDVLSCRDSWCEIRIAGQVGWMRKDHLWGVRADETIE